MRARPILVGGAAAVIAAGAMQLFAPLSETGSISLPSDSEFARGKAAFASLLSAPQEALADADLSGLAGLGFEPGAIDGVQDALLIREGADTCAGRGVYWLRSGEKPGSNLAITAPHRGSDRHTGTLAAALFAETSARAAGWNSAPRRASAACPNALDITREKGHLFSAFALGFAQAVPDGLFVQLHGFDRERRDTLAAREAGMILSNGTGEPDARLYDLADCLSIAFAPTPVLVYPGDTPELGALSNAQGQLLREAGFGGFVHIEISADLRAAMVEEVDLRARLGACLVEGAA